MELVSIKSGTGVQCEPEWVSSIDRNGCPVLSGICISNDLNMLHICEVGLVVCITRFFRLPV